MAVNTLSPQNSTYLPHSLEISQSRNLAGYFSKISTLVSVEKLTVRRRLRAAALAFTLAAHFMQIHPAIRHSVAAKPAQLLKSIAKSFFLNTLRLNLFVFRHLRATLSTLTPLE
jgi:hypothetical protein